MHGIYREDESLTTKKRKKELVTAGDPETMLVLPSKDDWAGDDFLLAPNLAKIGEELIASRGELAHLDPAKILYLFKRKGPEKPRRKLGTCQKPGGLLEYFSKADFIVCLMANNCLGLTNWQVEAVVYHELKHAGITEKGEWTTMPHDCECFAQEIERYGLWKSDLAKIARASEKAMDLPFELGIERGTSAGILDAVADLAKPIDGRGITSMSMELAGHPETKVTITAEDARHIRATAGKKQPEARA